MVLRAASLNGCGSNSPAAVTVPTPLGNIQHVVIIFQENRTPDNLIQDPVLINAGADIASSGLNSSGQTVPLTATPLGIDYDLSHAHTAFVAIYDGGKMDGADKIPITCSKGASNCPPPNAQPRKFQGLGRYEAQEQPSPKSRTH